MESNENPLINENDSSVNSEFENGANGVNSERKVNDNFLIKDNTTDKVLISICTRDRKKVKAFMSHPSIQHVIEKAKIYGLDGSMIVLAKNGCEICEDEVLVHFAKKGEILMLLSDNEEYVPDLRDDRFDLGDNSSLATVNESNEETCSAASPRHVNSAANATSPVQILWHRVPAEIAKVLHTKAPLGRRLTAFANFLIDELSRQTDTVTKEHIKSVAEMAVAKYPDSFLQKGRDEKQKLSPESLIAKMNVKLNANNNSLKRSSAALSPASSSSSKKRKLNDSVANGNSGDTDSKESLESKRLSLVSYYDNNTPIDANTIVNLMKECYPLQHHYFNNTEAIPDILSVKRNWPYIFDKEILYQYFEKLVSQDPRKFIKNFHAEKARIFKFFKNSTNKQISTLSDSDANLVRGLAYYFNENPDLVFKYLPYDSKPEDTERIYPVNGPWAAFIQNEDFKTDDDAKASIYIEGKIMANSESTENCFVETLLQLICYYYTFNMMYPPKATLTLEFLVFYLLTYSPEKKQGRRLSNGKTKINQLILKLKSIE